MVVKPTSPRTVKPAAFDSDESPAGRILRTAREQLSAVGYSALTMDGLAHELGMSKKTLYAHYDSKDAIVSAVIDGIERTIHNRAETILRDDSLNFTAKLRGHLAVISSQYGGGAPVLLRDLQRFAPQLYRKIDDLRSRAVPRIIGQLLRIGVEEGKVRPDVDIDFAVAFFLQAMHGLLNPVTLDRLRLGPREAFDKGVDLFFPAVLTEAGRREFTAVRPRTSKED